MNHDNPYRPPIATGVDVPDATPSFMNPPAPRPIAVWLMVVIATLMALLAAFGLGRYLFHVAGSAQQPTSGAQFLVAALTQLAKLAVGATVATGLWRRRPWSRWLGLALVAAFAVVVLLTPDRAVYADSAERFGYEMGREFIVPALCVWWGWAIAFTGKARRYFGQAS